MLKKTKTEIFYSTDQAGKQTLVLIILEPEGFWFSYGS